MKTNISDPVQQVSTILACMAQPARIQILISLCCQEACVCHLETALGMSQASISQHLMIMRKNGLVVTRREGRHIFYSLSKPSTLEVLEKVAEIHGIDLQPLQRASFVQIPGCPCPVCAPENDPKLICKKNKIIFKRRKQ